MADIDGVRAFWERHPLWSGESVHATGSAAYFDEHRRVVIDECFGGEFDTRFMPPRADASAPMAILDLGCGVGFWSAEFAMRGLKGIVAADLTQRALQITAQRLQVCGGQAQLYQENAEALSFADGTFDHVNCQGVVHHTPDTGRAIAEIARVLKPGGTASVSVYYRNALLRLWPELRWLGYPLARFGGGLKGRGREGIFLERDVDRIVRLYDGADNPIGKSYTRRQFVSLLEPHFEIEQTYLHYFPTRALPFALPRPLRRWLDSHVGFMIYANVRKPCVA